MKRLLFNIICCIVTIVGIVSCTDEPKYSEWSVNGSKVRWYIDRRSITFSEDSVTFSYVERIDNSYKSNKNTFAIIRWGDNERILSNKQEYKIRKTNNKVYFQ